MFATAKYPTTTMTSCSSVRWASSTPIASLFPFDDGFGRVGQAQHQMRWLAMWRNWSDMPSAPRTPCRQNKNSCQILSTVQYQITWISHTEELLCIWGIFINLATLSRNCNHLLGNNSAWLISFTTFYAIFLTDATPLTILFFDIKSFNISLG